MAFINLRNLIIGFLYSSFTVASNTSFRGNVKHDVWESNSVLSCADYLTKLHWDYDGQPGYYSALCNYEPAFGSWATCTSDILNDKGFEDRDALFRKSLVIVRQSCSYVDPTLANITLDQYWFALHNASKYLHKEYDDTAKLTFPVKVNKTLRSRYGDAYHYYNTNLDKSNIYGATICLYFFIVGFLAVCFRFFDLSGINRILFKYKIVNYFRGYCTLPTLNSSHAAYFTYASIINGLLPTRLESLVIAGYVVLNTVLLSVFYDIDPYNIVFESKSLQYARLVGDRSGIIAIAHLPLIILLSSRNSFLEFLTGFKYTTAIALHKWIGRGMVIDVCVHSIAYTTYALLSNSFTMSQKELYWRFGVCGTAVTICLCFFSLGVVRKHRYETFLYTHIILAVLFFYFSWKHLERIGWKNWIYVSLAVWIIERITRVIRILHFGLATANLELISDDLLRMTIPKPDKNNWKASPGQYVFLYFMHRSIFWQSHPFTVIDSNDRELLVVIRAKKGATGALMKELKKDGRKSTNIKVCVEGPYGSIAPLKRFEKVLLLCGGSGLPGPLAHAIQLGDMLKPNGKKTIEMIVTVRGLDILQAYKSELLKLQRLSINLQFFLTESATTAKYGSTSSNDQNAIIKRLEKFATFHKGRPAITQIIDTYVANSGSLAIVSCGPPIFVDNVRDVTAKTIVNNPTRPIEYFEEYQCW